MNHSYSTEVFEKAYTYRGNDLGSRWSKERTAFRLWAPTAAKVMLNLYQNGTADVDDRIAQISMQPDRYGTWIAAIDGDWNGFYYTFEVTVGGKTAEACDPYAISTGVNGKRAMILDMRSTDPVGWAEDRNPNPIQNFTDAVIYELHVRDFSIHADSGIQQKGKYLGVIETGTHTQSGQPTGLDHLKQLGITHLHLLPVYDFGSVDESHPEKPQYNWGYDPVNFNVPEGSYASDPADGAVRVQEFKRMVQGLHQNGISVIMDVVYNHVYNAKEFCFNQIVPDYFSRADDNGKYSNGSGCGNDTASERSMVHKYIVDSVNYWADEYHIDGFRFDLVGLLDTETIGEIVRTVRAKHPGAVFYGEGWDIPTGITKKGMYMAIQKNAHMVPGFAFFNDTIRDTLRGSVFNSADLGFVSGKKDCKKTLASCFRGEPGWTVNPNQVINYESCHDNHTLYDRIAIALPKESREITARRNLLAAAFTLTAQGVPFLHAGEELLRTKPGQNGERMHNSYCAPDAVNSIKWSDLDDPTVQISNRYYRGLLALRKKYSALRMSNHTPIQMNINDLPCKNASMLAFTVEAKQYRLLIAFCADTQAEKLLLPAGNWNVLVKGTSAGTDILETVETECIVPPISMLFLIQEK